jgi:hypothetical protein
MRFNQLLAVSTLTLLSGSAAASPPAPPCANCVVVMPAGEKPAPLLVVIPDAGESAEHAASTWRAAALDRGWGVLALDCPAEARCTDGAWSTFQGAPRWVADTVAALDRARSVDSTRTYLVGTGDGAAFVGMNTPRWRGAFAAVVLDGGGEPPTHASECPPGSLPAYFVGEGAARLERYYQRCEQEYVRAETGERADILDWLDQHARPILISGA